MADIIELTAFDFDSDRLEKGIAELQKNLFQLNKEMQGLNSQTKAVNKSFEDQQKISDGLIEEFKKQDKEYNKLEKSQEKLTKSGKQNTEAYKELEKQKGVLIATFQASNEKYVESVKISKSLTDQQETLFRETKNLQITRAALNKEYQTATTLYKQFIGVNGEVLSLQDVINKSVKQEATTRQEAKEANIQLNKIKDQLNLTNENELQLLNEINKRIDVNNALLRESGSQNEKRVANIGMYSESIQEAAGNLDVFNGGLTGFIQRSIEAGGAGTLVTNSFNQMKTGIIGLTRASFAFAATPIGAIVTILSTIVLIGRELFKYNTEAEKTERLIRGITKTAGEETTKIRLMGESIQEVFGSDLEETVQTAKVLVNEFGITYDEALDQIREGLIRGQEGNKQYLDSLREYSTFFAQAGYSVQEFRSIVSAGYDLGIYTDKLPDAIKEFSISINEQTKATRDSLVNAFGTEFTDNLLKRVREGKIGVNQALKEISEQAEKSNLDLQQQAQLTADVFRGAGEDAGGALKIFDAVNKAYADQTRELTELEKSTKEYSDAVEELGVAKDEALNSQAIISFKKEFNLLWTQAKTAFYNFVKFVTDEINFLNTLFKAFYRTAFTIIGQIQTAISNFDFSSPIESLKAFENIDITKTFSKNLDFIVSQQKELKKLTDIQKENEENAQANAGQIESRRKAQEEAAKKAEELLKKAAAAETKRMELLITMQKNALELWVAQQGYRARTLQEQLTLEQQTSEKSKAILDSELKAKKITQEKYDLEVLKMQQSAAKLQAQIAVEAAQIELDQFEYNTKSKLKNGELLTDELLKQELDRIKTIEQERNRFEQLQYDQGLINQTQLNAAKLQNEREYLDQEKALREKNAQDNFEIQASLLKAKMDAENAALKRSENNEYLSLQIKRNQLELQYQSDLELLNQQLANKQITQQQYDAMETALTANKTEEEKKLDKAVFENKLQLASSAFGSLASIFGAETAAGKAMAIAQTTIDTYKAATSAYSAMAGIPVVGPVLGAVAAAAAVAAGIANVKKITSTKTPTISAPATGTPKMAKGGLTEIGGKRHSQGGTMFYGEDGTTFEAEKGELIGVMNRTAASHFMKYNDSFLSGGLKSYPNYFANGGLVGVNSSNIMTVQQQLFGNFDMNALSDTIRQATLEGTQQGSLAGSQQGTAIGSQQGISQLSSNRAVQVGSMD